MARDEERMRILQMIEEGKITADEGLRLLNDLQTEPAARRDSASTESAGETASAKKAPPDPQIRKWRRWWMIPMWFGVAIIVLGSLFMYWAYQSSGIGFWFLCSWIPFLGGVAIAALAWSSRASRWVHLRVDTGEGDWPRNIAISLPIPTRIVAWAVRAFGWRIPALKRTAVDELLAAIDESLTSDSPIYIDVMEGEKGERVQVYIG